MRNHNQSLIEANTRIVLAVAGGGTDIIGALTCYGGMSSILLESIVPTCPQAMQKFVGGVSPYKIVSPQHACMMGMAAYFRALEYTANDPGNGIRGVAASCSLAKDGPEREGRQHRVCVAVQYPNRTESFDLNIQPGMSRIVEEVFAAQLIRKAIQAASGLSFTLDEYQESLQRKAINAEDGICKVVHGESTHYPHYRPNVIMPTSMNPLHTGHLKIAEDAARRTGQKVVFELSVRNADKPPLDYIELYRRLDTASIIKGNDFVVDVIVSNASRFIDKAKIFPGSTFVVGADTMDRIYDHKYYQRGEYEKVIDMFRFRGNRFLVYPRFGYTPRFDYDWMMGDLVTPVTEFEPLDISSTQIRQGTSHDAIDVD